MDRYSIILPVRNGGEYVKLCVHSILSQSLPHFNLIILDNNSTDGTKEWIRSLHDERIVLHESDKSLTIEENWGRIISVNKNEFITLIGHDDLLDIEYLSVMDRLISENPHASLYQTHFRFMNANGGLIRKCKPMAPIETATDFLKSFLTNQIDVNGTGYMMRSADYDAIGGIPPYPSLLFADFELWIRLTQMGYRATSPEECFSFRIHQSTTSNSTDRRLQMALGKFINFLVKLKNESPELNKVILEHSEHFLLTYCKGLSHRLLRTPLEQRDNLSVKSFLEKCKTYADMLNPGNHFNPLAVPSIRIAKMLDQSAFGRKLFLQFKRIYSKPLLK
jgi:glycosyltransferase involved in cell wall biosynthesis